METPYITCRTPTKKCDNRAVYYVIYGCLNQHILEIAICERHYDYNSIYLPACPRCHQPIEDNEYIRIEKVTVKHQNHYITRSITQGGTPTED